MLTTSPVEKLYFNSFVNNRKGEYHTHFLSTILLILAVSPSPCPTLQTGGRSWEEEVGLPSQQVQAVMGEQDH